MQRPLNPAAHSRPAFSLVELMIVIVIIGLLVGILIPVLSKAYKTALASADSALLAQISMGCEAYQQAFHEYPNSTWVADVLRPPATLCCGAAGLAAATIPQRKPVTRLYPCSDAALQRSTQP